MPDHVPGEQPAEQALTPHEAWLVAAAAATAEPTGAASGVVTLPRPGSARRLALTLRAQLRARRHRVHHDQGPP